MRSREPLPKRRNRLFWMKLRKFIFFFYSPDMKCKFFSLQTLCRKKGFAKKQSKQASTWSGEGLLFVLHCFFFSVRLNAKAYPKNSLHVTEVTQLFWTVMVQTTKSKNAFFQTFQPESRAHSYLFFLIIWHCNFYGF